MPASLPVWHSSVFPFEFGMALFGIGPLPICNVGSIHTEPIGVLLTCDALVNQLFPHAGTRDAETWHSVDGVDGNTEAIGLIADGELQRRVDVALFLVAAHVDVALAGSAIGEPMNKP